MYIKQKGFLPQLLFFTGLLIHLIFIVGTIPAMILEFENFLTNSLLTCIFNIIIYLLSWIGVIWSIPLLLGSLLVSAFPEIRTSEKGIGYRSYKLFSSIIYWEEIEEVISLSSGYKALRIKRKGSPLLNGLYSNQLYGYVVNVNDPVLLLSPKLGNLQTIMESIQMHKDKKKQN
jgi:hypothetical protein